MTIGCATNVVASTGAGSSYASLPRELIWLPNSLLGGNHP